MQTRGKNGRFISKARQIEGNRHRSMYQILDDLYNHHGMSSTMIAKAFHVCHSTILNWLKKEGIPVKPKSCSFYKSRILHLRLIRDTGNGLRSWIEKTKWDTTLEAASKLQVHSNTITKWRHHYGLCMHCKVYRSKKEVA